MDRSTPNLAQRALRKVAGSLHVFDRSQYQERRRRFLARRVDIASTRGLEFGGFDLPTVPPELGDCAIADIRGEIELSRRFDVPMDSIQRVDCILQPGIPSHLQISDRFDYVVLCHVLEHVVDVITMLNELTELLVPGGTLFIALPDKRRTPDAVRPSTRLATLVERQLDAATTPSLTELAEFSLAWNEDFRLQYEESMKDFFHEMRSSQLFGEPDIHCNVWRDDEFIAQVRDLIGGDYLPELQLVETQPLESPFNEFYVALERVVDGDSSRMEAPLVSRPSAFYRTCNFCGSGRFRVWKRLHAPFPERIYSDTPPEPELGRALSLQYLSCRECDLSAINPVPRFDLIDRHRFSAREALDRPEDEILALVEDRRRVTRIMAEQHDFERYRRTGRLLDVSCGLGGGLSWLRDEGGWDVRGVEPAREFVEFASARLGLDVHHGLVQDLPDAPGSFDVIMIDSSLQCVFDPLETLLACHRLLREGGCLFAQVPNRDGLGPRGADLNVQWGHWFFYTPAVLHRMLEQIGFRSERLFAVQNPIDPDVLAALPSDVTFPESDLVVQLVGGEEIEEALDGGCRPRADFFGLSARKRSHTTPPKSEETARVSLTDLSRASRVPRQCVAIDPNTDVRWPWESAAAEPNRT